MADFTYAIGDLHGRFDLLENAILAARDDLPEGKTGELMILGDFVDRGPDSRMIIDLLMQGPLLPDWRWTVLKGNHEAMMCMALESVKHINWWVGNGGGQTLLSYGAKDGMMYDDVVALVPQRHRDWLDALPVFHIDAHRAYVHAGFNPDLPLKCQSVEYMTWCRDSREADYSFEGRHVVHGHEQYADGPILNTNKTNLDVFAWLHGRIALGVFDNSKAGGPIKIIDVFEDDFEDDGETEE